MDNHEQEAIFLIIFYLLVIIVGSRLDGMQRVKYKELDS